MTGGTWPWMILTASKFSNLTNIFPSSEDINAATCRRVELQEHITKAGRESGIWMRLVEREQ